MKARAIVVEDEVTLREQLEELLARVWPELEIVASVGDGLQAVAAMQKHRPDLMFLDVEMPEMSGIDVARHASEQCHVVFVTAYSSYTPQAFDAGAVDYVLKPYQRRASGGRVQAAAGAPASAPAKLDHVLAQLAARVAEAKPYLRWITASRGANVRMITIEEVCYFQADTKYTLVALPDGDSLIHIADQGPPRAARSADVLADPPLDDRQRAGDRYDRPRRRGSRHRADEAPHRNATGQPAVRLSVPPDVRVSARGSRARLRCRPGRAPRRARHPPPGRRSSPSTRRCRCRRRRAAAA